MGVKTRKFEEMNKNIGYIVLPLIMVIASCTKLVVPNLPNNVVTGTYSSFTSGKNNYVYFRADGKGTMFVQLENSKLEFLMFFDWYLSDNILVQKNVTATTNGHDFTSYKNQFVKYKIENKVLYTLSEPENKWIVWDAIDKERFFKVAGKLKLEVTGDYFNE